MLEISACLVGLGLGDTGLVATKGFGERFLLSLVFITDCVAGLMDVGLLFVGGLAAAGF